MREATPSGPKTRTKKENIMNIKSCVGLNHLIVAALMMIVPAVYAQNTTDHYATQPNKSLAAAHESFLKKDMNASAAELHKASAAVKRQSGKVSADAKDTP